MPEVPPFFRQPFGSETLLFAGKIIDDTAWRGIAPQLPARREESRAENVIISLPGGFAALTLSGCGHCRLMRHRSV